MEVIKKNNISLDIFKTEVDKCSSDPLEMSDIFGIILQSHDLSRTPRRMNSAPFNDTGFSWINNAGIIASAIETGFDFSSAHKLVADGSHFSKDIRDGLKKGIYKIGESIEVSGNYRPAIVDQKGQLIKFFTLKRMTDLTATFSDISNFCMQAALQQISSEISALSYQISYIVDSTRNSSLKAPFISAKNLILQANSADNQIESRLNEADSFLTTGLANLYLDMNSLFKRFHKKKKKWYSIGQKSGAIDLKTIDDTLSFISEDLQLIPRYVGFKVHLLNYRGETDAAMQVLGEFRYHLDEWIKKPIEGSEYSAIQLIHSYYPYNDRNLDFWLEKPQQMFNTVNTFLKALAGNKSDIYLISAKSEI